MISAVDQIVPDTDDMADSAKQVMINRPVSNNIHGLCNTGGKILEHKR